MRPEKESLTELEALKQQFENSLKEGAQKGDLLPAQSLYVEIKHKIHQTWSDLGPFYRLHPELKSLVESNQAALRTITVGGQRVSEIKRKLKFKQPYASFDIPTTQMLYKRNLITLSAPQEIDLLALQIRHLGFTNNPDTIEIERRATQLGLQFCPPEAGPQLILDSQLSLYDTFTNPCFFLWMTPYVDTNHFPHIFFLYINYENHRLSPNDPYRHSSLSTNYITPHKIWELDKQFIFAIANESPHPSG